MHRSRCLLLAIVALALLTPSVAFGQAPGVTFDDGPSSKEYAIPLDAARGATKTKAPTPKRQTPTTAAPATPPPTATATTPQKASKKKKKKKTHTTTTAIAPVTTTPDPPRTAATSVDTPASSSDATGAGLVIGGLALSAIVLGGLAGLLLRRRRKPIDEY